MGMMWVGYRRDEPTSQTLPVGPVGPVEPGGTSTPRADHDESTRVDLDKHWHAIHWLLTGSGAPTTDVVSTAIFSGEPVVDETAYGGETTFRMSPDGVRALAGQLSELGPEMLRARLDPAAMTAARIYPQIWDPAETEWEFDEGIAPAYEQLRTFYAAAAAAGQSVIQIIC